ncbi:MAG: hypothetical protein AMXMBFR13_46170 [Phycisphaerae bacterium]
MKHRREQRTFALRAVGVVASLLMVAIAAAATMPMYRLVAPAILIAVLWGLYGLRGVVDLNPFRYGLVASAMLLHMLGGFGFYQQSFLPFSYDILVHFYFALVLTVALHHALQANFPALRGPHLAVVTFFFLMGLAALHEIMEYGTYLVLGEERGMLKPSTSYFFDTQRDLTNNLLGTLVGLLLITLYRRWQRRKHLAEHSYDDRPSEPRAQARGDRP